MDVTEFGVRDGTTQTSIVTEVGVGASDQTSIVTEIEVGGTDVLVGGND